MNKILLVIVFICLPAVNSFSQLNSDTLLTPSIVQQDKDTLYFDQNTYPSDSIYIKRLLALPFEFKMSYNPIVKRYIELYTYKTRKKSGVLIGLSDFYFPIIDKIFETFKLPTELKYIAIIESSLNPRASSPANAAGLWQFMRTTGKLNGLTINSYVDERRGVIESTQAVAKYLLKLNSIYNDWQLTLAAYNCGPARVNKAIRMAGGKSDFWKIYRYLPQETKNFVPAYIGVAYMFNYYKKHGIKPVPSTFPSQIDTIQLSKKLHFKQISDVLGLDINTLRMINPQYLRDIVPANEQTAYYLNIPTEHKARFLELKDSIYTYHCPSLSDPNTQLNYYSAGNSKEVLHRVASGENLWLIARRYGVSVNNIKEWNNLTGTKIKPGRKLIVYLPQKRKSI